MRKIIQISVMALLFVACDVTDRQNIFLGKEELNSNDTIKQQLLDKDTCAFSPALLHEIMSFISESKDCEMIIPIRAERNGDKCHLFMTTEMYYNSHFLVGYQIIDGRMVACYNDYLDERTNHSDYFSRYADVEKHMLPIVNECLESLIDMSKLKRGYPTEYPNENTEGVMYWDYDPIGRRYIIHSPDSLELVFEGYY